MRYRVLDENGDFTIGNEHAYIEARMPYDRQCSHDCAFLYTSGGRTSRTAFHTGRRSSPAVMSRRRSRSSVSAFSRLRAFCLFCPLTPNGTTKIER